MDTYSDCAARHWFAKHDDGSGQLRCDDSAAKLSTGLHEAVMRLGREAEVWRKRGNIPPIGDAVGALRRLVSEALFRNRVDVRAPVIAERLAQAQPGLDLLAEMIVREATSWAPDPVSGMPLVWYEQWLDSGQRYTGVIINDEATSRTRADTIGVRVHESGKLRPVVRDHKAKKQPVDPRFDNGILVRAIWVAGEIQDPQCPWFLRGRNVELDTVIELETVNLLHGKTDQFVLSAEVTVGELGYQRNRLAELMAEMAATEATESADYVSASPSALCTNYCPFLHRCQAGQDFVSSTYGAETLRDRLSAA